MTPIDLHAQGTHCQILVAPGLISHVGAHLRSLTPAPKAMVVTDSTVGPLHLPKLLTSLHAAGFQTVVHTLLAGETHKHLETLLAAYTTFLDANIDRGTPLIALGGGVTGDMAGLIAGTLLRGVPFVQVPTTLMAMVDSAIGGKTAVNHKTAGKNLIGVFHQPLLVLTDPELLLTLPTPEISNGLAECVKHDAIRDPAHLAAMPDIAAQSLAKHIPTLTALAHHNAAIKAKVVTEDPLEKGVRAHLNLGHTFAHAIEQVCDHAVPHGVAVSLGLAAATHLSLHLGLLSTTDRQHILSALAASQLPTTGLARIPNCTDTAALLAAMRKDKKVEHGKLRFVLLNGLGHPIVRSDIEESAVSASLSSIA